MNDLISTGKLAKLLGVSLSTIYRWLKRGKIEEPLRTFGNHRRFNENNFKEKNSKTILYSRVSSYGQKDDLKRQSNKILTFAKENNYKNIELIEDIGSGLNYNKKGFKLLLNKIVNRQINTIIIQHKDRLSRFGIGIIQSFAKEFGTNIMIIEKEIDKSKDIKLMNDLMALLTSFTGSIHGRRSHQNTKIKQKMN